MRDVRRLDVAIRPGQVRTWQPQQLAVRILAAIPGYDGLYKVRPWPDGQVFTATEHDLSGHTPGASSENSAQLR